MRKLFAPVALVFGLVALAGCSDPKKAAQDHVRRGDVYMEQGKPAEAILQFRNAVQKDPQLGEARKKLGLAQLRAGNGRAALNHLVRAADLLPEDTEVQLAAGSLLLLAQQFDDASARADKVLARDPQNVDAHLLKANASAGLKDLDAAVAQIEEAVSLDPQRMASYASLAAMEAARGRHEQAEAAYLKAIEMAPNAVEPRLAAANYYLATGRRADFQEAIEAALRIDPKNLPANRAMAMYQMMSGNAAEAERHLKVMVDNTTEAAPRIALADFYIGQQRAKEAAPLLEELAKQPETFAPATTRLAGIAYTQGDKQKGHEMLDSVLAKEPSNVEVMFLKGRLLLGENRIDDARKVSETALKAAPDAVQAHQLAGMLHVRNGQVDEAIASFQEVVKRNPKALAAQLQLARLFEAKGGHDAARQHARDAVTLAPQSGAARYALVRSLIASGDLVSAERELAPIQKAAPDAYEVQLSLGRIAMARGNHAAAQAALDKAVAAQPTALEALNAIAILESRNKRLPRAIQLVRTALDQKPQDPGLLVLSARLDAAAGDLATAEQTLRRVLDASPDYLPAYEVLGTLYVRQKNLDAARAEYEQLAAKRPTAVGPQTMVAMLHQVQGRSQDAVAAYQKILAIDSRAVVANNNLAYIYAEEEKNLDMALQMAQAAKAASPDDPDVNDTLGWVYYKKGMALQAIGPLLQSTRINPENPLYHYHLGLAYMKNGDRTKARESIQRSLSLGNFAEADAARRALENLQ